jgi:flavin reductase (DIM6/NTAB) family NADH-FMN oxidoreductase RutF
MPVSGDDFRSAMRQWASGVTVVTARNGEERRAILVTSFLSVSLDPPTILVSIKRGGTTHRVLEAGRIFAVHILHEDQAAFATALGYDNDEEARSLRSTTYWEGPSGAPILDDCLAYLDCRVVDTYEAKDHTLYIGLVEACGMNAGGPLLHWEREFRRMALEPRATRSAR